jgi:hypothetical protein
MRVRLISILLLLSGCPSPECESAADCDDNNPCTNDQCAAEVCQNNPDDALQPTQNAADDCLREACAGGLVVSVAADNEVPAPDGAACVVELCQDGAIVGDFAAPGAGGCNPGEYCDADNGCIQNVRDIFASPPNATLFGSVDFAQATNFTGLAIADLNDDGTLDVASSEPDISVNVNGGFRDTAGQIKVSFGPFSGSQDAGTNGLTIFGAAEGDRAGLTLAACDFDGDGDDDLFIGSPNAEPTGFASGQIVGVPGPLTADVDLNQIVFGAPGLTINGDQPTSFIPDQLLCADINQDGADDLLVGAANASPAGRAGAGAVFVFLGGALNGSKVLSDADITISGHSDAMHLGGALAVGDLNDDGTTDLIVGAPQIGANQARPEGVVVLPGTLLFDADGAPIAASIDLLVEENAAYIDGGARGLFGFSLRTGDLDGDGTDDLAIGALLSSPQGRNQAGEVDVIYGQSNFGDTSVDANATQIFGFDPQDETGISIAIGEHNGDGRSDLVVGAHRADGLDNNRPESGEVFVFLGGTPLARGQIIDLTAASPSFVIFGGQAGDSFGKHIQMADIDANGKIDILIAAQQDDTPEGRIDAGSISIVLAPPN